MLPNDWQDETLEALQTLLEPDGDVRALVLFGSLVDDVFARDAWADIDVMLVVRDGAAQRFFPSADWLTPIGEPWAIERSTRTRHGVIRACFADSRRIDVIVVEEAVVADIENWDGHPLHGRRRTVFSRSPVVDRAVSTFSAPLEARPYTAEQFEAMTSDFWFTSQFGVKKVVRGDLLIGLHLALGLVRDCCVLEMLLRDRAAGTRHHRTGGPAQEIVARLVPMSQPYTRAGILDTIEEAAQAFDRLAAAWSTEYKPQASRLLPTLAAARNEA